MLYNAFHDLNILQNADYVQKIYLQNLGTYIQFLIITLRKVLYCDIIQVKSVFIHLKLEKFQQNMTTKNYFPTQSFSSLETLSRSRKRKYSLSTQSTELNWKTPPEIPYMGYSSTFSYRTVFPAMLGKQKNLTQISIQTADYRKIINM
jgi:hypothetical protein